MKKLTAISLIVFLVIVTSILTAGLVIYQNKKDSQTQNIQTNNVAGQTINNLNLGNGTLVLNIAEISKHNTEADCWMLINGKVYNITSYFGSHPGGNAAMLATCGKDATAAYTTKDPNAINSQGSSAHSSRAVNLLSKYYIGDLNQTLTKQSAQNTIDSTPVSVTKIDDRYEYEDD